MLEILSEYKTLITGLCIAAFLLIFRKELNKLIDWIVSFKKIAKTTEGYSASTHHDYSGTQDKEDSSNPKVSLVENAEVVKSDIKEEKTDWWSPFFDKNYDKACDILRDLIAEEDDAQKKQEHRATLGFVLFKQDNKKGCEYFDEVLKSNSDSNTIY